MESKKFYAKELFKECVIVCTKAWMWKRKVFIGSKLLLAKKDENNK